MRKGKDERKTNETSIVAEIELDGKGQHNIISPLEMFRHLHNAFAKHGALDLYLNISGDLEIDQHHTVEDTGLVLGTAIRNALGDMNGINRSGFYVQVMDDAAALLSLDISGRPYLTYDAQFNRQYCGDLDTDVLRDYFQGFTMGLGANILVRTLTGVSDHHKAEAIFKGFGKALAMACSYDSRLKDYLPSDKGIIDKL
ncbi:imidazoleglycerol-phosphate dehydratase [Nanoarchaeota archaeon]